jgi:hypothetical protein
LYIECGSCYFILHAVSSCFLLVFYLLYALNAKKTTIVCEHARARNKFPKSVKEGGSVSLTVNLIS